MKFWPLDFFPSKLTDLVHQSPRLRNLLLDHRLSAFFPVGFTSGQTVRNLSAIQETQVRPLVWKDALEKRMATHSSILAQ